MVPSMLMKQSPPKATSGVRLISMGSKLPITNLAGTELYTCIAVPGFNLDVDDKVEIFNRNGRLYKQVLC